MGIDKKLALINIAKTLFGKPDFSDLELIYPGGLRLSSDPLIGIDMMFYKGLSGAPKSLFLVQVKEMDDEGIQFDKGDTATNRPDEFTEDWIKYMFHNLITSKIPNKIKVGKLIKNNFEKIVKLACVFDPKDKGFKIIKISREY